MTDILTCGGFTTEQVFLMKFKMTIEYFITEVDKNPTGDFYCKVIQMIELTA